MMSSMEKWGTRISVLKPRLSRQGSLPRGLFKETLDASVSTALAGGIVRALAAHFLLSAGIL